MKMGSGRFFLKWSFFFGSGRLFLEKRSWQKLVPTEFPGIQKSPKKQKKKSETFEAPRNINKILEQYILTLRATKKTPKKITPNGLPPLPQASMKASPLLGPSQMLVSGLQIRNTAPPDREEPPKVAKPKPKRKQETKCMDKRPKIISCYVFLKVANCLGKVFG